METGCHIYPKEPTPRERTVIESRAERREETHHDDVFSFFCFLRRHAPPELEELFDYAKTMWLQAHNPLRHYLYALQKHQTITTGYVPHVEECRIASPSCTVLMSSHNVKRVEGQLLLYNAPPEITVYPFGQSDAPICIGPIIQCIITDVESHETTIVSTTVELLPSTSFRLILPDYRVHWITYQVLSVD